MASGIDIWRTADAVIKQQGDGAQSFASRGISELWRRPNNFASRRGSWRDGIVPFGVECIALDIEGIHFGVADLDALRIGAGIKFAAHV